MNEKCMDNCPVLPRVESLEEANKQHSKTHRGMLYKSKIDGNTTEPGADDRWWEIYVEV